MNKMCLTDPITHKSSITITLLFISFALFIASVILHFLGIVADWKIGIMLLFPCGMFFAAYHHKRVKISFTGIEVTSDRPNKQ